MNFLYDWKLWLFVITFLGILINWLANQKLVKNDLRHISEDIKKLFKKVECIDKKMVTIKTDVAVLQEKTKTL